MARNGKKPDVLSEYTGEDEEIKVKIHTSKSESKAPDYHDEIILMIAIAASIILFLSNFNLAGSVGESINQFIFGLFGSIAYISPLVLIAVVLVYIYNRKKMFVIRKILSAIGLIITVCSVIQLANYDASMTAKDFYNTSSTYRTGGGLLGGMLCKVLCDWFDVAGALVVLIVLAVIFLIIITDKIFINKAIEDDNEDKKKIYNRVYEEELNQYQEYEYVEPAKPKKNAPKRKAQTYTFEKEDTVDEGDYKPFDDETVKSTTKRKTTRKKTKPDIDIMKDTENEEQDGQVQTNPVIQNVIIDVEPNEIRNVSDEEIFEKELKNKFGKNNDRDIKILADDLLAGNITYSEEDSEDFEDDILEEEISNDIILDENSDTGQMSIKVDEYLDSDTKDNKRTKKDANAKKGTTKSSKKSRYKKPPVDLLEAGSLKDNSNDAELQETARKLQATFDSFNVGVTLTDISCGPAVTRYELQPDQGVKVSKITALADDIKLNLAATDIRIEAPIPGKAAVGIEVPNKGGDTTVKLRELIESKEFKNSKSSVSFAVGKDISGQVIIADIAKMPHLLIAGQTGSGKSVCINTLIMSILYKANPEDVKLIMIDPKVVELSVYNGIPHLLIPVVTDPKKASGALNWAVAEMTDRYAKFAEFGVRDMAGFNKKVANTDTSEMSDEEKAKYKKLPQVVIVVDELADLMMVAPGEVEDAICRLAQMARAAGLHLIIATQRPSVNVITGLIKANVPSRIAFSVASAIDSRTILDGGGAEKLLGKGDMLFYPSSYPKPVRVQGAFVSDKEVGDVVDYLKEQGYETDYDDSVSAQIEVSANQVKSALPGASKEPDNARDDYFVNAGKFIIEKDKASIGMLQRVYKIGFNRAARIMDQLCEAGVVGPEEGTKARKVIMTEEEFNKYIEECM